ncbi:MAG: hypothetical protein P8099_20200 [Gemmatimonadota bacterium]
MVRIRQNQPPIVMRRHHRHAPLVDEDATRREAWGLVLVAGWVLVAVGLVDVALAWYPVRAANPSWEFRAMGNGVPRLPVVAVGLALVALAALLTERRRVAATVAALGLGLGAITVLGYLAFLHELPLALRMASPEAAPAIRKSVVRVTFMCLAFSGLFIATGVSVIRYLRRNPL